MGLKSVLRLMRNLGSSLASQAQFSWSLLAMALVMGLLLGRIASKCMEYFFFFLRKSNLKGRGKGFWAVLELPAVMVLSLSERDSLSAQLINYCALMIYTLSECGPLGAPRTMFFGLPSKFKFFCRA